MSCEFSFLGSGPYRACFTKGSPTNLNIVKLRGEGGSGNKSHRFFKFTTWVKFIIGGEKKFFPKTPKIIKVHQKDRTWQIVPKLTKFSHDIGGEGSWKVGKFLNFYHVWIRRASLCLFFSGLSYYGVLYRGREKQGNRSPIKKKFAPYQPGEGIALHAA